MTTILVVDDREDVRLELKTRLEKRGYAVELAVDGKQSITFCQRGGVDAVLMDMNMPEMDGCEATGAIKADLQTALIPVILCTAHPLGDEATRASQAGGDGFLEKPISIDSLIELLAKLLQPSEPSAHSPTMVDN